MSDYECHITIEPDEREVGFVERLASLENWKSSFIKGDPDLGKGDRFFLTKHETNFVANVIECNGISVIRKKIELIIADTRAGTWNE